MRINNFLLLAVTATVQLSSLPFTSATKKCKNGNDNYGCGAGYQEDGYFNIPPGDYSNCKCCCRQEDAGGFHENTCDGIKSNAKGCGSCMGERACYEASNAKIGDNSCVNGKSCYGLKDSSIKEYSCRSDQACKEMERTSVGSNSCGIGSDNAEACYRLWDSTVGDNSCKKNVVAVQIFLKTVLLHSNVGYARNLRGYVINLRSRVGYLMKLLSIVG